MHYNHELLVFQTLQYFSDMNRSDVFDNGFSVAVTLF